MENITIVARHLDITEAIKNYALQKAEKNREQYEERPRQDAQSQLSLEDLERELEAEPVPDAEWKEMNRRAREGVSQFLASPVFERIRASDPGTWFPIEKLDSFDFEGVPVWVALDFAMRTPDGAEVFDWKTGSDKSDRNDGNRLQVLGYALYLAAKENVPAERVVCRLVYVNTGTVLEMRPTAADLDAARAEIRESMAQMRRRLRDPSTNSAEMLAFPMTDDLGKCAGCSFRRLCNR